MAFLSLCIDYLPGDYSTAALGLASLTSALESSHLPEAVKQSLTAFIGKACCGMQI